MPTTGSEPQTDADTRAGGDEAVIQARGLVLHFGDLEVLRGLDLAVEPGTIYGFIGPSGSGKTTGVRALLGALVPTAGEARLLGEPPTALDADTRARIGYMPQHNVLFPDLSLRQNLSFVASIHGLPLRRRQRLRSLLAFLELDAHRKKRLADVSGGMQRRLALAAALVHEPEVLFLDEPTTGIDPVLRRRFWDHFAELRAQGRTVFVTTQYVGEAAYCDRVAVLEAGRVTAEDSPEGLRRRAYGGDPLVLDFDEPPAPDVFAALREHPRVVRARQDEDPSRLRLVVDDGSRATVELPGWLQERGHVVRSAEPEAPPFDDVFVHLVEGERDA